VFFPLRGRSHSWSLGPPLFASFFFLDDGISPMIGVEMDWFSYFFFSRSVLPMVENLSGCDVSLDPKISSVALSPLL